MNSAWTHFEEDPTVLIVVDTNDAGDRLEVSRGQQLIGVSGKEDAIYHTGDDLEGLGTPRTVEKIYDPEFSFALETLP